MKFRVLKFCSAQNNQKIKNFWAKKFFYVKFNLLCFEVVKGNLIILFNPSIFKNLFRRIKNFCNTVYAQDNQDIKVFAPKSFFLKWQYVCDKWIQQ